MGEIELTEAGREKARALGAELVRNNLERLRQWAADLDDGPGAGLLAWACSEIVRLEELADKLVRIMALSHSSRGER